MICAAHPARGFLVRLNERRNPRGVSAAPRCFHSVPCAFADAFRHGMHHGLRFDMSLRGSVHGNKRPREESCGFEEKGLIRTKVELQKYGANVQTLLARPRRLYDWGFGMVAASAVCRSLLISPARRSSVLAGPLCGRYMCC